MSDTDPEADDTTAAQPDDTDEAAASRPARTGAAPAATRDRRVAAPRVSPPRRGRTVFGALAVILCLLLGVAIATQVRQTTTGDSLDTARPADLLVLLDSLRQREATLNTEVAELQRSLNALQASGSSDQAAIQNAQARLAALSILIGTVGATGPGVTVRIDGSRARALRRRRCSTCSTNCGPPAPRPSRSATGTRRCAPASTPGSSVLPAALIVDGKTLIAAVFGCRHW